MRTILAWLFCLLLVSNILLAQSSDQQMPGMNMPPEHKPSPPKKKQQKEKMSSMPGMNMQPGDEGDFAIAHSSGRMEKKLRLPTMIRPSKSNRNSRATHAFQESWRLSV